MKTANKETVRDVFQLNTMVNASRPYCYWCGQGLRECGTCKGIGLYKGLTCQSCKGLGRICPVHQGDWEK